jgi:hypothetical protein
MGKLKEDKEITVLFSPDLHCGSIVAPMPARVTYTDDITGRDITVLPSDFQKEVNRVFDQMVDKFEGVDIMVMNGDAVEGQQQLSNGRFTWTNDLNIQAEAAASMLKRVKAKQVFGTMGSKYHNGKEGCVDKVVTEKLGGRFGGDILINIGGVRCHFAHYIANATEYRTTALCKEIYRMENVADVVVRSHLHRSAYIKINGKQGYITPCFQGKTPFGTTHGMYTAPTIGFSWMKIKNGEASIYEKLFEIDQQMSFTVA